MTQLKPPAGPPVLRGGKWTTPPPAEDPPPPSPDPDERQPFWQRAWRWYTSEDPKREAKDAQRRQRKAERSTPQARLERRRTRARRALYGVAALFCVGFVATTAGDLWGATHPAPVREQVVHEPATGQTDLAAQAFAVRFAWAYLSYNQQTPSAHADALKPFLGSQADTWDQVGTQSVQVVEPTAVTGSRQLVTVDLQALVEATPQSGGSPQQRWLYLAAVIGQRGQQLQAQGPPVTIAPPPAQAAPATGPGTGNEDYNLTRKLTPDAQGFFGAWGAGDLTTVSAYSSPSAQIPSLGGQVKFQSLPSFSVGQGGDTRHSTAQVDWQDSVTGARQTQGYAVTWVYDGSRWLVQSVSPEG